MMQVLLVMQQVLPVIRQVLHTWVIDPDVVEVGGGHDLKLAH